MEYEIAIISLGRPDKLMDTTITMLYLEKIDFAKIKVFIVEEQREAYINATKKYEYPSIEFISGIRGIVPQREFVENHYPADTNIICLDDDVVSVDYSLTNDISLDAFYTRAFMECRENHCYIWSVYPVYNPFFRNKIKYEVSKHLSVMIGAFYGIINRPNLPELRLTLSRDNGEKEDVERTIKYFIKDKIVLRYNSIGFKTKYFGNDGGGLGKRKDRIENAKTTSMKLLEEYEKYGKISSRKDGYCEFQLKKIPHTPYDIKVIQFQKFEDIGDLFECLNKIPIRLLTGKPRRGFGKHRAVTLGIIKPRFEKDYRLSLFSRQYPEIHNKIFELGKKFVPFEFNTVHLNKDVVCPPHYDSENVDESILFSFGNYEGGKIVINGMEYDAYLTPTLFDGSKMEHYNTPLISGTKYSLVFYKNKYEKNT